MELCGGWIGENYDLIVEADICYRVEHANFTGSLELQS